MQTKHLPVATISIIILNGIVFAIGLLSGEQTQIIQNYCFIPNHIYNADRNNNAQQVRIKVGEFIAKYEETHNTMIAAHNIK